MCLKHMSLSTKRSYVNSITNYIYYSKDKRDAFVHPTELGPSDIHLYKQMLNLHAFVLLKFKKFKDAAQKIRVQKVGEPYNLKRHPEILRFLSANAYTNNNWDSIRDTLPHASVII